MCNNLFKGQEIDDTLDDKPEHAKLEEEDGIINLKINTIPKRMVDLECIFDLEKSTRSKRTIEEKGIEECDSYNLGTKEDPKCWKWEVVTKRGGVNKLLQKKIQVP